MEMIIKHGRYSTYVNHRCRCDECKQANAMYSLRLRMQKRRLEQLREAVELNNLGLTNFMLPDGGF